MPRITKDQRKEIEGMKGKSSQREVAEMFGVNPSSVSRIWARQDDGGVESEAKKEPEFKDRFDVEVTDRTNMETINIDVQDEEFFQSMNQMLDGYHQEIEMGGADKKTVAELPNTNLEGKEEVVNNPRMPAPWEIPDDILNMTTVQAAEGKPVTEEDKALAEVNKFLESGEVSPDMAMDVVEEKPKSKKKGRKRKVEETIPEIPEVQFQVEKASPWTKDLLVARINAYVQMHTKLLKPYIGSGSPDDFLVKIAKFNRDKLEETYINLRSLVQFKSQTQTCMVGAVMVTQAVEQITSIAGLQTRGLTMDLLTDEKSVQSIQECCEDYVMDHPSWFAKVNRPEIRFAQVVFAAAQKRHTAAMNEEAQRKAEQSLSEADMKDLFEVEGIEHKEMSDGSLQT